MTDFSPKKNFPNPVRESPLPQTGKNQKIAFTAEKQVILEMFHVKQIPKQPPNTQLFPKILQIPRGYFKGFIKKISKKIPGRFPDVDIWRKADEPLSAFLQDKGNCCNLRLWDNLPRNTLYSQNILDSADCLGQALQKAGAWRSIHYLMVYG